MPKGGDTMKKLTATLLATLLLAVCLLVPYATPVAAQGYPLPADVTVHAASAILVNLAGNPAMDVVLYEKAADEVRSPGAMMRYMVLAYALHRIEEKGLDIDADTGAYSRGLFNEYVAGTGVPTANMAFGEEWTLRDLLTVSFIHNASDAVVVLAEAIDGDVRTFIDGMNTLAAEIGCTNSHFYWLSGLDSLSQYTTARDMYRIVRYCQRFSLFEDLAGVSQVTVNPVKNGSDRTLTTNNHLMLTTSTHYYAPLVHSRTGLSDNDGRTCAAVARDSGYEYLVMVMGCPEKNADGLTGLHYRDAKALLKWAFKDFEYKTVLAKSEILASVKVEDVWKWDHVNLVPAKEVATVVDKHMSADQVIRKVTVFEKTAIAPIDQTTVYGKVELYVNVDQKIGEMDLVAAQALKRNGLLHARRVVFNALGKALPFVLLGIGLLVLLAAAYVAYAIAHNRRRRNNYKLKK